MGEVPGQKSPKRKERGRIRVERWHDTEVETMRTGPRRFRPFLFAMEQRINLSFSISTVVHSLFPFVPDNSAKAKHHAAVVKAHSSMMFTPEQAAAHPRLAAARAAHIKIQGQPTAPAVGTTAHPRGTFNWYAAKPVSAAVRKR